MPRSARFSLNDGASYDFNSVPAGPTGCTADGAISGLDGCTVGGYSTAVGPQTVTATAKDKAGNPSTKTLSYTVKAATAHGFCPLQRPGCHGRGHRTGGKDALQGAKPSDLKATRASGRAVVY
jgi:hypothetical protein